MTPLGGVGFSQYMDMQQGAAEPSSARPRGTTNRGYASSDLYNSTRPRHANERIHRRPQQSTGEAIFGTPRGMAPRFSGNEPNTENLAFRASTPLDSQSEGENLYDYNWENRDAGAAGGDWQQAAGAHFGRPGGLGGGGRPETSVDHTGGTNGAFCGPHTINTFTDVSAVTAPGQGGTARDASGAPRDASARGHDVHSHTLGATTTEWSFSGNYDEQGATSLSVQVGEHPDNHLETPGDGSVSLLDIGHVINGMQQQGESNERVIKTLHSFLDCNFPEGSEYRQQRLQDVEATSTGSSHTTQVPAHQVSSQHTQLPHLPLQNHTLNEGGTQRGAGSGSPRASSAPPGRAPPGYNAQNVEAYHQAWLHQQSLNHPERSDATTPLTHQNTHQGSAQSHRTHAHTQQGNTYTPQGNPHSMQGDTNTTHNSGGRPPIPSQRRFAPPVTTPRVHNNRTFTQQHPPRRLQSISPGVYRERFDKPPDQGPWHRRPDGNFQAGPVSPAPLSPPIPRPAIMMGPRPAGPSGGYAPRHHAGAGGASW